MNLASLVAGHADAAVALVEGDRRITYVELRDLMRRSRSGLRARAVGPGTRLGIVAPTGIEFVVTAVAALAERAVIVPLNPAAPAPELRSQIAATRPDLLAVAPGALDPVVTATRGTDTVTVAIDRLLDDVVASDPGALEPPVPTADADPAVVLFTSGTAGGPKPAVLTHGSVMANLDQLDAHPVELVGPGDVVLGVLPLFHVLGLTVVLGTALRVGATVVLVDRFDPLGAVEVIRRQRVTTLVGPPALWAALAALPDEVDAEAFGSVRLALSGAAPLDLAIADRIADRFGLALRQGYGLTEMSPVVSLAGPDCPVASVGTPLPGVEVRVVDSAGADVLVDDVGEIWVRGPNRFAGYLDDPRTTAQVVDAEGWLHTGDLGMVDRHGRLTIVGRAKELIVVSGFNVHPSEVESVLVAHPAVDAAAIVGEPDAVTGEQVVAHVVVHAGESPTDAELDDHVRANLAGYKCPARYVRTDAVPTGVTGKIRRRDLDGAAVAGPEGGA